MERENEGEEGFQLAEPCINPFHILTSFFVFSSETT